MVSFKNVLAKHFNVIGGNYDIIILIQEEESKTPLLSQVMLHWMNQNRPPINDFICFLNK